MAFGFAAVRGALLSPVGLSIRLRGSLHRLRAAREAAGHSLATMAALTHFSKPYLGHVETGHRQPIPDVVDRYEQALGVPIGIPHDPVRTAHEWLCGDHPPTPERPKVGRRLGAEQLRRLEARVVELRHRDDVTGSRELLPVVRAELDSVSRLADDRDMQWQSTAYYIGK